jgi:hypothetical protein
MRIHLTQGQWAEIDLKDVGLIAGRRWCARKNKQGKFYACCGQVGKQAKMHRLITGAKPGQSVDHIDGDGLNNRRHNLRICAHQENCFSFRSKPHTYATTSKFRGVSWDARCKRWFSKLETNGKQFFLGRFHNEEDAARAYDAAALEHFGEFACPNFRRGS